MLKQLSAQDASFAFMETPATPMHVGAVYVYGPGELYPDGIGEQDMLRYYQDRLHLWPNGRQRLVRVPFDADYPYWVEDENFDIEYHVRRVGLPRPADWDALLKLASRIMARPLDMTKPLWEFYLIEGLDHLEGIPAGSIALLTKTHHAAIDGASGMHLIEMLHDLEPTLRKVPPPAQPWHGEPVPTDAELLMRAGFNNLAQPFRFAEVMGRSMAGWRKSVSRWGEVDAPDARSATRIVPKTRFNGRVSGHRAMGFVRLDLEEVKRMRKVVPGATVNDAVLTICGGALRAYLDSKMELPKDPMVAMAPVNVRKADEKGAMGNRVSALFVQIGTHIEDPLERLAAIRAETRNSKTIHDAVGAAQMTDYTRFVPAFSAAQGARLMSQMAGNMANPPFNVSITNVPGPQVPLYFMGAPMLTSVGFGPITHGMGMIMPILSYCGELVISFTSCRDMLPDPEFFTQCIRESFEHFRDRAAAL